MSEQEEQAQSDHQLAAELPPEAVEAVAPNKKISDAEPEELVQALRQVFNQEDGAKQQSQAQRAAALRAGENEGEGAPAPEAKSGYKNPFHLFADVFYGVLIAPRQTLSILGDRAKFPPTRANLLLTVALVLLVVGLPAAMKATGSGTSTEESLFKSFAFIFGTLCNWAVLSFILYYLSIGLRPNRLTLGNAFIATGWAFLPFAFFAPVACFKSLLGGAFIFLACLPAVWFLYLQWTAFQTALRVSTFKLALIALVVPPILCLVYLFWIGLAVFSLLSQLLSHLS